MCVCVCVRPCRHVLEVMAFNGSAEPAKWVSSSRANSLARSHREVTILFADIVTFTNMCSVSGSTQMLHTHT